MSSRTLTHLAALAIFVAFGCFTSMAIAQSDADLRRENDALRAKVNDLEAELKAARDRLAELEKSNKDLDAEVRKLRAGAKTTSPSLQPIDEEKVTIDESLPEASPRALMRAAKDSYAEAIGELEMGAAGSRDRNVYLKQVENWINRVNREYRRQIVWAVRVEDATVGPRGFELLVQAVDPETDVFLGPQFPVRVTNRTLIRRLQELGQVNQLLEAKMELKGVLMPEIRLNANREAAGTFDNPPLIGPFAEFLMTVDVTSLRPWAEVEAEKPNAPNAPAEK